MGGRPVEASSKLSWQCWQARMRIVMPGPYAARLVARQTPRHEHPTAPSARHWTEQHQDHDVDGTGPAAAAR
ncbi:hypothetical protein GCM10010279_69310 [Streptomyces mutabilis]|nr:hypothetical protein GCM10010279_69310 [Streptomyces mutabilis]